MEKNLNPVIEELKKSGLNLSKKSLSKRCNLQNKKTKYYIRTGLQMKKIQKVSPIKVGSNKCKDNLSIYKYID